MERVTSSEDVKWPIGGDSGISRNGSELGLQEIFKGLSGYPSVSNFLAQLGESASSPSDEKLIHNSYQSIDNMQEIPGSADASVGQAPYSLTHDSYSRGIPRAPSLEVLKMLIGSGNTLYSHGIQVPHRPPGGQSDHSLLIFMMSVAIGGNEALNASISGSPPISVPQGGVIPPAPHSAILTMNPAAAAALQFSQFQSACLLPQTIDMEVVEKSEQRRARRMLSNRESARRSRKRKQEHLQTLEEEIGHLKEEKQTWLETKDTLTRRCQAAEEESSRLKEENSRLRDELNILSLVRSELCQAKKVATGRKEAEK